MFDINTKKIKNFLQDTGLKLNAEFFKETSALSSFRAGGKCICIFYINNMTELCTVLDFLKKSDISFYIIGGGTNTLFADDFIDTAVIKLSGDFNYLKISVENNGGDCLISAGAACSLERFVVETAKSGFDFSFLAGIPGTLGGAVAGNAGNSGNAANTGNSGNAANTGNSGNSGNTGNAENSGNPDNAGSAGNVQPGICRYLKSIRYAGFENSSALSLQAQVSEHDYGYRVFKLDGLAVITDIYLKPDTADRTEIFKKIRHNIKHKKSVQPLNTKNAGCFFKNPPAEKKYGSGEMIDMCGLKGLRYGGAGVSEKHANFLENYENATAGDIYVLSKIVRDFVKKRFKINLEYEVKLVGF